MQLISNKKSFTFLTIILLYSLKINAQIVTDRPDQTESSSTVGNRNLQIETGLLIGFEGDPISTRQLLAPTTLIRYGLLKAIELRIVSQFESLKNQNSLQQGISDLEVGTKIQLYQKENSKTEIAFLTHLVMPTGTIEISDNQYGSINKLSISHQFNDRVGLGYNLGYNYFGTGKGNITYSFALGISINDRVGLYIEPYGEIQEIESFQSNFDGGFTYLINDNLQLDFSFGQGISTRMNYLSLGCSWLILHR